MRWTLSAALLWVCAACGDDREAQQVAAVQTELARVQSKVDALEKELEKNEGRAAEPARADALRLGQSVQLELAKAKTDPPQSASKVVSITTDAIYFADERVTLEQLQVRLRALAAVDPDASLVMRASKEVPYERLIEVMDRAKQAGVHRFAVAVASEEQEPALEDPF